ncbi:Centrosomal protein of 76 kDa [Durusdinium trenchii]|uniref:Centrosomal protein of 76 kDa n=1 Tax=Durusdinium trenchii TaxID=1381693 RepID=A0ABP0LFV6_9DINO
MLSGILWQGTPPEMEAEERRLQERAASRLSTIRMTQYLQEDLLADYQEKTKELAGRGVRLRNILDFWEKLLEREIMPSFDPAQSKTNDVVRQAIIPMTRQGHSGVSMATYWNDEEDRYGKTGVWKRAESDSIRPSPDHEASIAEEITSRRGFETVRTQLNEEQLDDATYWICAFSVNQHASICGGFGREPNRELHPDKWSAWYSSKFDSVSKKEFTVCECEQKKIFSHKDPHCELNKFDDMMNYLQQKDRRFGQLVVVDEAFEVLNRAWCIAEIMEGNSLHEESKSCSQFQMRVNVFSRNSVDLHYDNLAVLDVTKCDATSEEDKQFILSKVSGREEAFNLKLQDLIFGCQGLFNPWIDVKERTRRVGLIWRRCAASTLTGEAAREAFSQRRPTLRTMWSNLRDEDGSSLDSDGSDV